MNMPVIISVAPNGSSKTKNDHPNLPISPAELAKEAEKCKEEGATLIHLHVRDDEGKHTLDVSCYQKAIEAIRKAIGGDMVIQVTTEAVGIYTPEQQMQMIKELKPEAVSIAIKELIPEEKDEANARKFLNWMINEGIAAQYVVYSDKELKRFYDLKQRQIIPGNKHFVLFVLGRYVPGRVSTPEDLAPFLAVYKKYNLEDAVHWAICAFGKMEAACMIEAAKLGGHVRIGFENNMHLMDGSIAQNNAELVRQFRELSPVVNRHVATIEQARELIMSGGQSAVAA
jgi:3-keto-5-aminohexanoate cleavage enzyme